MPLQRSIQEKHPLEDPESWKKHVETLIDVEEESIVGSSSNGLRLLKKKKKTLEGDHGVTKLGKEKEKSKTQKKKAATVRKGFVQGLVVSLKDCRLFQFSIPSRRSHRCDRLMPEAVAVGCTCTSGILTPIHLLCHIFQLPTHVGPKRSIPDYPPLRPLSTTTPYEKHWAGT